MTLLLTKQKKSLQLKLMIAFLNIWETLLVMMSILIASLQRQPQRKQRQQKKVLDHDLLLRHYLPQRRLLFLDLLECNLTL